MREKNFMGSKMQVWEGIPIHISDNLSTLYERLLSGRFSARTTRCATNRDLALPDHRFRMEVGHASCFHVESRNLVLRKDSILVGLDIIGMSELFSLFLVDTELQCLSDSSSPRTI